VNGGDTKLGGPHGIQSDREAITTTRTDSPDLMLHRDRFTTLNQSNPVASAVAIKDGYSPQSAETKRSDDHIVPLMGVDQPGIDQATVEGEDRVARLAREVTPFAHCQKSLPFAE
jgi:hypothetical protein